jgi:hypothetical protein
MQRDKEANRKVRILISVVISMMLSGSLGILCILFSYVDKGVIAFAMTIFMPSFVQIIWRCDHSRREFHLISRLVLQVILGISLACLVGIDFDPWIRLVSWLLLYSIGFVAFLSACRDILLRCHTESNSS